MNVSKAECYAQQLLASEQPYRAGELVQPFRGMDAFEPLRWGTNRFEPQLAGRLYLTRIAHSSDERLGPAAYVLNHALKGYVCGRWLWDCSALDPSQQYEAFIGWFDCGRYCDVVTLATDPELSLEDVPARADPCPFGIYFSTDRCLRVEEVIRDFCRPGLGAPPAAESGEPRLYYPLPISARRS